MELPRMGREAPGEMECEEYQFRVNLRYWRLFLRRLSRHEGATQIKAPPAGQSQEYWQDLQTRQPSKYIQV